MRRKRHFLSKGKLQFRFGSTRRRLANFALTFWWTGRYLIELKTGRDIDSVWEKQLLNYLRATDVEVGLLFNFGPSAQFRRYVFENNKKNPRNPRESAEKKLPVSCR